MRFGGAALEDVEADLALPVPPSHVDAPACPSSRSCALEDVEFTYDGTDEPTLRADRPHHPPGRIDRDRRCDRCRQEHAGRPAGRAHHPTAGRITVDGVDLAGREAEWQADIGLVSQHMFLLDDSLRRNIALGVADDDIDEAQVAEAVRLAQLEEFVASLPNGLDTTVGERGVRVSGGQRQRVAIARALYREPSVLVFDEGTSALDNLTEAALTEALTRLRQQHTLITVAHRLSTVQDHDRIVFLHDGRIVDVGPYDELARRSEAFRRLARWSDSAV
jgi:ATP-binding cassette, subfamily B, bacterial PglK